MANMTRDRRRFACLLGMLIVTTITPNEVQAVSNLNPTRTCVFSAVKARLTKNDLPLQGVTVVRRWNWNEPHEDSTVTDANGEFNFPAVFESSVTRLLPLEIMISQSLYAIIDGEERKFWYNAKRDETENGEYGGRPTHLLCEMTHKMKIHRDDERITHTLCTLVE
jgi:hypothetical protein